MDQDTADFFTDLENAPDEMRETIESANSEEACSHIRRHLAWASDLDDITAKYTRFFHCSVWCHMVLKKRDCGILIRFFIHSTLRKVTDELDRCKRQLIEERTRSQSSTRASDELQTDLIDFISTGSTQESPTRSVSASRAPQASSGAEHTSGDLHDLLECSVCYQRFVRPLQLHCGHTFCSSCVDRLTEQASSGHSNSTNVYVRQRPSTNQVTITCPECRKPTLIPAGGLTVNYRMNEMIERVTKADISSTPAKTMDSTFHCEGCNDFLPPGGAYFTCCSCSGTVNFLCAICIVRKHHGHKIVEKKGVCEVDIEAAKEDINLQSSRAWRAIDQVEARINQISSNGQVTVLKTLRDAVDHYGALADGLHTISNETAELLEDRKALAMSIAEKFERVAKNIDSISAECNKGFAETAKDLVDFLKEVGIENGVSTSSTAPIDVQPRFTRKRHDPLE